VCVCVFAYSSLEGPEKVFRLAVIVCGWNGRERERESIILPSLAYSKIIITLPFFVSDFVAEFCVFPASQENSMNSV